VKRPLVEIDDLVVEFKQTTRSGVREVIRAVDGVSLDILAGETLGLVGESGCGKSTLGRALLRLVPATRGTVRFDGVDLTTLRRGDLRRARADMQMVFQDPFGSLNPRRRVGAIVAEPLVQTGTASRSQARAAARGLLERVGLGAEDAARRPHEFSGGQRQRISIARALAPQPRFIVADEPVSALDVSIQAQIINLLADIGEQDGLTMLFISHDLGVVRHVATRIAVMYLGQLIEVADRDRFFAEPWHPYSAALLSAVPALKPPGAPAPRERIVLRGDLPNPAHPPPGCRFHGRCPHAVDVCRTTPPALRELAPGRLVRCHLPLRDNPPVADETRLEPLDPVGPRSDPVE
jgi:oligopeptide/dipeptide ABC transporter ATP-binding protein